MDSRGHDQSLVAASHLLRNAAGVCLVLFLVLAFFPVSGELFGNPLRGVPAHGRRMPPGGVGRAAGASRSGESVTRSTARGLGTVAALLCATAVGGCQTVAAPPPNATYTVQPSFAPGGGRLEASRHPDGLCLEARFDGGEPGSGACGFSEGPTAGRYVVSSTDSGVAYTFGPVPRDASTVRIRLADGSSVDAPTAELPQGLADGRYFFTALDRGAVIDSVLILDAAGATVEPRDF